jgi:hypothetical protein
LKSDTDRRELAVADENAYPEELINNYYDYEIGAEEGYAYPEDCEEGFEFCKNKKVRMRIIIWNKIKYNSVAHVVTKRIN